MSQEFVGNIVSLDCGEVLGTYQGQVSAIDNAAQTLTITKAFRNGIKCQMPNITLSAADICDLQIITSSVHPPHVTSDHTSASAEISKSSKCVSQTSDNENNQRMSSRYYNSTNNRSSPNDNANKRSPNHHRKSPAHKNSSPVNGYNTPRKGGTAENGFHGNGHAGYGSGTESDSYRKRTSSASEQYERRVGSNLSKSWKNETAVGSFHRKRTNSACEQYEKKTGSTTPRKIENPNPYQNRRRGPREDCFSAPTDSILDDFDFDANLALFDKQAVFDEIDKEIGIVGYPKIVRPNGKNPGKYKHDENVLESEPVVYRQIQVPDSTVVEYVTDSGLVVPSVTYETRSKILELAEKSGLKIERQLELVGRSASEMVLQLLGGSHRLTPKNAHQRPNVIVLCGPHLQGAYGVNCARHLSTHNVNVTVFVPNFKKVMDELHEELQLFDLTDGKKTSSAKDLPTKPIDMIINALDSHDNKLLCGQQWYLDVVDWANNKKASALTVDPPLEGGPIDTKWSLSLCLPLPLSERCGQVYLCDLGVPKKILKAVGITYMSPFGHKFVVALHNRS